MNTIAPPPVAWGVIHFSNSSPLVVTACGLKHAPFTTDWKFVTCGDCLAVRRRGASLVWPGPRNGQKPTS